MCWELPYNMSSIAELLYPDIIVDYFVILAQINCLFLYSIRLILLQCLAYHEVVEAYYKNLP